MKKQVFFWNNENPLRIINDLGKKPMSGTWTAVLNLSKTLNAHGIDSTVVNNFNNSKFSKRDVLVVLKNPVVAYEQCINFKKTYLWCHDNVDSLVFLPLKNKRFLERFLEKNIKIICVSEFQKNDLIKLTNIPKNKILVIKNGINLEFYKNNTKKETDCIFVSPPYRGLNRLIRIWPEVVKEIPSATLKVFSSISLYGGSDSKDDTLLINKIKSMKGVTYSRPVNQKKLIEELEKSRIFIYPASVNETSSITTLQAKAAGCIIITNKMGALPESAEGNIILENNASIYKYTNQIVKILKDDKLQKKISNMNICRRDKLSWNNILSKWIEII